MGLRARLRKALRATDEDTVTLICNRCGAAIVVDNQTPLLMLVAAHEGAAEDPALDAALSHPCQEGAGGPPWSFREADPGRDGTLAELASVLLESRRSEDEEPH